MRALVVACLVATACDGDPAATIDAPGDGGDPDPDAMVDAGPLADANTGAGFRVGGIALGIREPVRLDIDAGGSVHHLTVSEDGNFRFPRRYPTSTTFTVTTTHDPLRCKLVAGTGAIGTDDVTSVRLYCIRVVELAQVAFAPSVIDLAPSLMPAAIRYGGTRPLFFEDTDLVATTATAAFPSEATIEVYDVVTPSGQPSAPHALEAGGVRVQVSHTSGLVLDYVFDPDLRAVEREAYVKSSDTTAFAGFGGAPATGCSSGLSPQGNAVAISGDVLVVGAPCANSDTGAVYVYRRSNTTWAFEAKLTASTSGAGHLFGASVAIDGTSLVVGAPAEAGGGYAEVFTYAPGPTPWTFQQRLLAGNRAADDLFGTEVAIAADTVVVGAPGEDSSATGLNGSNNNNALEAGAAYIFTRTVTWAQTTYVKASDTGAGDNFGRSVAIAGTSIVVGAPLQDSSGAVYVFVKGGTWAQQQGPIKATGGAANDRFGASVSIDGDRLAVGAADHDVGLLGNAGAAYVFARSGTTWSQDAELTSPTPAATARFGGRVALDRNHVVVGAVGEAVGGAAYAFRRDTTWGVPTRLTSPTPVANNLFGSGVAVDGDSFAIADFYESSNVTGVSNTPSTNTSATRAGAVYVYR